VRKKNNILYISEEFNNKNGANKSASDVLISLIKAGNKIKVVSYSSITNLDRNIFSPLDINKINWVRIKRNLLFPDKFTIKLIVKFIYYSLINFFIKAKEIDLKGIDLIIVNSLGGHQLLEELDNDYKGKKINIFRGSPKSFGIPGVKHNTYDILNILKKYDILIHVSNIVKKKWIEYEELKNIHHLYIPNCCEEERIRIILQKDKNYYKSRVGLNTQSYNVVYIASVQYRKGHDILIEKIPEIINKIRNLEIYFIGKKIEPYYSKILKRIEELGIKKKIHFMGERKNALEYLYASDLLLFPSRAEAMPRVILESMILKTPIIASDVDGIPELIMDRKHGLLFPIEDPDLMINLLEEIYLDKTFSENLVIQANIRYWANFSRGKHILRYKRLMDDLTLE